MKKNDIYLKENLEIFANDLLYYLYNNESYRSDKYNVEKLSDNILIYTLNKRYYVDEKNYTYKYKNVPIFVEDNIDVEEWLDFYNKKTLTFTMDSVLSEYLYDYDVPNCETVSEEIRNIFKKHGFNLEFGNNTTVYAWTKEDYPNKS